MTGGNCGTQKIEVPVVSSVNLNQIVFQTPVAAGGFACLAGQQVDVQVLNPTTGKTASCPGCFKYYSCPSVIAATPNSIPSTGATAVVVAGNNFEEPVEATFEASGIPSYRLTVTSVSSTSVVVQMPPLSTIAPLLGACQSITGSIKLTSTSLAGCSPVLATLTYRATTPTLTSATPDTVSQDGGSATITVKGSGFTSPMSVTLTKNGSPVSGATDISASVTDSGTLTFPAPAVPDGSMNYVNCSPVPGGPVNGTKAVPTQFGIRVTNGTSGCSSDLPNVLMYNPLIAIAVCTSALQITTSVMSTATVCSPYSFPVVVTGGTPPYFGFSASGLPSGLSINPATGVVTGTPVLSSSGAGGSSSVSVTVNVQDTASTVATKPGVLILFNDPTGPFSVSGTPSQTVPSTGNGPASAFSVVGGTGTINWSIDSGAPAGLTIATPGNTSNFVAVAVASGSYSVKVRATDSLCSPAHTNTVTVTVNVP
jgi:hypothetical protein